ncbi:MAG: NADH-quinone oxidoreductase subunit B family protein [Anaerolineae bacterium]|jgi:NADH-quinone oxidoreductase B subunit|nr:NADH-quinone oxidoreductase subunit B family protein [Anaerolineae bacterium]
MTLNLDKPWQPVLDKIKTWARINSPWAIHFNSGSCNGCDIEILATLTPRYDLERFGVKLQGSPRHADILICTGPVTRQARDRLVRIYEQMPEPKFVVAVGSCALSGGVFQGCYNVMGGIDKVLPVDAYIPGCPPRPEAIIDGLVKLLTQLQEGAAPEQNEGENTSAAAVEGAEIQLDAQANGEAK